MKTARRLLEMTTCLIVGLALVMSPKISHAGTTAKTSTPPAMAQIESTYSGYTYLSASNRIIADNKNQTATITATTQAKTTVVEIGATVQLQEWTGTTWIDVGSTTTLYSNNTSYISKNCTKTTRSGYYYRARVYHYVKNGITEGVTEYTDNMLAS